MTPGIEAKAAGHVGDIALRMREPATRESTEVRVLLVEKRVSLRKILRLDQPAFLTDENAQREPFLWRLQRCMGEIGVGRRSASQVH
jgi:hypothetical protein